MPLLAESGDQCSVRRDLNQERRHPNDGEQGACDPESELFTRFVDCKKQDHRAQFDEHHGHDDPCRLSSVASVVGFPWLSSDSVHQRIMHDLNEPDQAGHEP